jgi:hypothetical protein
MAKWELSAARPAPSLHCYLLRSPMPLLTHEIGRETTAPFKSA